MFPLPTSAVIPSLPHDVPVAESFQPPQPAPIGSSSLTEELRDFETCILVLDVLESFGSHISKEPTLPSGRWAGKPKFLRHVFHWVRKNEPIMLTIPAFPCKSVRMSSLRLSHILILADNAFPLGQPREQGPRSLTRSWWGTWYEALERHSCCYQECLPARGLGPHRVWWHPIQSLVPCRVPQEKHLH